MRPPEDISNDISEDIEVTHEEALECIRWWQDRSQENLDKFHRLTAALSFLLIESMSPSPPIDRLHQLLNDAVNLADETELPQSATDVIWDAFGAIQPFMDTDQSKSTEEDNG